MITHVQVKALRNICFKISKLGSNTDQYSILRLTLLDAPDYIKRLTPEFVISCETPAALRAFLSKLIPAKGLSGNYRSAKSLQVVDPACSNLAERFTHFLTIPNENRAVYKRRQRFLEQQFAELVYWSERNTLSSVEIEALMQNDCFDRATMDHMIRLMCDCVEVDPRRSLVVIRHFVLDSAIYLLDSNGVSADVKLDIQELFKQIIHMAEHPTMDQEISFSPDRQFVASLRPLIDYIDNQNRYCDWEESNRTPDYPSVQTARHFCHAAILICETLWQWALDDVSQTVE